MISGNTVMPDKAEGERKRDELFAKDQTCMHCGKPIASLSEAVAVYFVQRGAWKLTHRMDCAFEAMFFARPMKSLSGPRGRTMPGVVRGNTTSDPEAIERTKAFYMLYTPARIREKTTELFQECPICSYCNERVRAPDHATALLRNRDQKWLLVHEPRCSMRAVMEENQRLADEAIPAEQAARILAENAR